MRRTVIFGTHLLILFSLLKFVYCEEISGVNNKIKSSVEEFDDSGDGEIIRNIQKRLSEIFANGKSFLTNSEQITIVAVNEEIDAPIADDVLLDNKFVEQTENLQGKFLNQNTKNTNNLQREFPNTNILRSFTNNEETALNPLSETHKFTTTAININLKSKNRISEALTSTADNTDAAPSNIDNTNGNRYGYLNEWVVHVEGGHDFAQKVFTQMDYKFHGPVSGFTDLYRVLNLRHPRLHKRAATELSEALNKHDQVVWAEQQESKIRVKRGPTGLNDHLKDRSSVLSKISSQNKLDSNFNLYPQITGNVNKNQLQDSTTTQLKSSDQVTVSEESKRSRHTRRILSELVGWPQRKRGWQSRELSEVFNDDMVDGQWYLHDTRTAANLPRLDLGALGAWQLGVTGQGVRVAILDDGLDYTHADLKDNYDPDISHDFNSDTRDPFPRFGVNVVNSHGTKCAGEVAMAADNNKCGVGVAFNAKIGGVRMLDGDVSDRVEAESLSHARGLVDVVSCSWGPTDDGKTVEGPGLLAKNALKKGVEEGRGGKGTIFVWASGNGGATGDNCNCDGYASSVYTASITSASQSNTFPWYGELCASTIAAAYSSGAYSDQKITSTDLNNTCTNSFSGTSAAAPLAAGIVALALEANPTLGWRDVQHLMVLSSNYDSLSANDGWQQNALGLYFNLRFGFGLLDAEKMVSYAKTWKPVAKQITCRVDATPTRYGADDWSLTSGGTVELILNASLSQCPQWGGTEGGWQLQRGQAVVFLEHVEVVLTVQHSKRGALNINCTSPRGTSTTLLTPRPPDVSPDGFNQWPFMSVNTWGEDPVGAWTVHVQDTSNSGEGGEVTGAYVLLHAAAAVPQYAAAQYQRQYQ